MVKHIMINLKRTIFILFSICIFLTLLLTCGCSSKLQPKIVVLHAGGGYNGLSYLNAQETFDYYYNMGYRYFEYDFQLSSDGRLIGTHAWEHLETKYPSYITYEDFKKLKLSNGFTPANEEWLMQTIMTYPDVKFIIDSKSESIDTDVLILQRIEALESVYNYDISSNIIPEIFSIEMWEEAKQTTSFDKYLFSHYKVYYSVSQVIEHFNEDLIWGIALSSNCDNYYRSQIHRFKNIGKEVLFFTPTTNEEVQDLLSIGGSGVYVDNLDVLN